MAFANQSRGGILNASPVTEKHSQAEVKERQEKISLGSLEEVSREGEFRIQ